MKMRRVQVEQAAEAAREQRRDFEVHAQSQRSGAGADASAGRQAKVAMSYSAAGSGWGEVRQQGDGPLGKGLPSWSPPTAHLPPPVGGPDEATRLAFCVGDVGARGGACAPAREPTTIK